MKMKYFRFWYGEIEHCLLHFGELRDARTEETFTFLYLRETGRHVSGEHSAHRPFLFPERFNLVIAGRVDSHTQAVLKEFLKDRIADVLVTAAKREELDPELASRGKEIVWLSRPGTYRTEAAGWYLAARADAEGTIALAHGLLAEQNRVGKKRVFEDCIMNIKALDPNKRCCAEASPDGYGCALGCVLHQDHDVCGYRSNGKEPLFGTGTLLLSGEESEQDRLEFLREVQEHVGTLRFVGPGRGAPLGLNADADAEEDVYPGGFRRYFIGAEEELDDRTVTSVCRGGWYNVPVVLREGELICCSGLLRYKE